MTREYDSLSDHIDNKNVVVLVIATWRTNDVIVSMTLTDDKNMVVLVTATC